MDNIRPFLGPQIVTCHVIIKKYVRICGTWYPFWVEQVVNKNSEMRLAIFVEF
jgi:hypothetical protein